MDRGVKHGQGSQPRHLSLPWQLPQLGWRGGTVFLAVVVTVLAAELTAFAA
jgi:hypothetical protein